MAEPKALRRRLDKMREARRDAMYRQARRDIAMDLLETNGEVTAAQIDERMAEAWAEPDDLTLANMLAAKTRSAVVVAEEEAALARLTVSGTKETAAKYRALVEQAEEAHRLAQAAVEHRDAEVEAARELAEMAGGLGNADAAPQGRTVQAHAGNAETAGS